MTRYFTLIAAAAFASTGAFAQSDPFSNANKAFYGMIKGNLVKSAEKMPEANYSFKPTPEVRSFGELVGHVVDAQYMFCSTAKGEKKDSNAEKGMKTKAALVEAIKASVAYCDDVYNSMNDTAGAATVKFFGRDMSKNALLEFNVAHDNEHYGNMVTYLRLKQLVPPSSESSR